MSSEHTITLRYFAAAEAAAGRDSEELTVPSDATLGWLRSHLLHRYGDKMERILRAGSFLVDGRVRRDDDLIEGTQVDVLPPFAGG